MVVVFNKLSKDDGNDSIDRIMEFVGCFSGAPLVLREEEYFGKVLFDKELLLAFGLFKMVTLKII